MMFSQEKLNRLLKAVFVAGLVVLLLAGCQATAPAAAPAEAREEVPAPGETEAAEGFVVGALHVGAITDAGYNQAHHDGLVAMTENLPNVKLIEAENVPESADAERVMENMIQQGAKLIFPQSFGYLDPALAVAARHPDVIFMHPAGFKLADNLGTYWGNNFEAMYLAGIAAGEATETNKLGFITAFPIPNILASVNAFHLGAKSVNPEVETTLVFNGAWVDPTKEAAATNALADTGVDVVTMIVDSPVTIVKTAEERGIYSVGFHSLALKEFAPNGWLTGVAYTWGDLYTKLAEEVIAGTWKSEHIRGGMETGFLTLAPYGPAVSEEVQALIAEKQAAIIKGELAIFAGPITDNEGTLRIPEGEAGGIDLLDTTDWLVEGVIGQTE
ncbi:MAG TPA: BMP family ABC transporter substrate-binding protein [Anaerolineae bacterium]|nr:BMP family ABC transporter substrate-binding protein [Anaerolineae bacterium]